MLTNLKRISNQLKKIAEELTTKSNGSSEAQELYNDVAHEEYLHWQRLVDGMEYDDLIKYYGDINWPEAFKKDFIKKSIELRDLELKEQDEKDEEEEEEE